MAMLTNAQRDALPIEAFGFPERKLFPVTDQEDLDRAALLLDSISEETRPTVKSRLVELAKKLNLRLPQGWEIPQMAGSFSIEVNLEGEPVKIENRRVTRQATCMFVAGDYPDKKTNITPEDIMLEARNFKRLPINLEHKRTVFDGMLGDFTKIGLAADGKTMTGEAEIPEWLDKELVRKLGKVPLSVKWNPETRRLEHVSLVVAPRIEEAALAGAFAAAVASGEASMAPPDPAVNGNGTPHGKELLKAIKDMVSAELKSADPATTNPKFIKFLEGVNSDIDKFMGASDSGNGGNGNSSTSDATAGAMSRTVPDPEIAKLREELAQQRKASEAARIGTFTAEGSAFASALLHQFKITPAEKDNVAAQYTQAAIDDDRNPDGIGAFADGKKLSRVARFRADKEALPVREDLKGRTTDQLAAGSGQFSLPTGGPPNELEKARLQAEAHAKRVNERRGRKTG
jgi:hypothetical protein